ncbi:MAG: hypothetical protein CL607_28760 [Anaerolineaceae bacterium]|jgi:hypothetical protein|nr:hypothetical protein [Anaerolineaceae bacterium]|tara:strand:- start:100 stop:492 length:393 start_codon:yes stop_codon:yes gene_type:complete
MSEVNNNQVKAAQVLANGGSVLEAAEAAGVTERTVYNWRHSDMAFRAKLTELKDAVFFDGYLVVSSLVRNAALVLQSVMDDETASNRDRISAARAVLSSVLQIRENYELQERLERIEQQLATLQEGATNG